MADLTCSDCKKVIGVTSLEKEDLDYLCLECYEAERLEWALREGKHFEVTHLTKKKINQIVKKVESEKYANP